MVKKKADQIIERIAKARGVDAAVMRQQIEDSLQNIIADTTQPHSIMLRDLFPYGMPTVDEFVVLMEDSLYNTLVPDYLRGSSN